MSDGEYGELAHALAQLQEGDWEDMQWQDPQRSHELGDHIPHEMTIGFDAASYYPRGDPALGDVAAPPGSPLESLEELRDAASQRWLTAHEVLALLSGGISKLGLRKETEQVNKPDSGTVLLFSKIATKNFRNDGHSWKTRKNGKQLDEAHMKLKVNGDHRLQCYYSQTEDGSLARRIYSRLDDRELVLVHYLKIPTRAKPALPTSPIPGDGMAEVHSMHDDPRSCGSSRVLADVTKSPLGGVAPRAAFAIPSEATDFAIPSVFESGDLPLTPLVRVRSSWGSAASGPNLTGSVASFSNGVRECGGASSKEFESDPSASRLHEIEALIRELELQKREIHHARQPGKRILSIVDFSPEWDDVAGGAKMLVTADIMQGFSYVAKFGEAMTPCECIAANVLRLRIPPSATGKPEKVALQLLRLSNEGSVVEDSEASYFSYRSSDPKHDVGMHMIYPSVPPAFFPLSERSCAHDSPSGSACCPSANAFAPAAASPSPATAAFVQAMHAECVPTRLLFGSLPHRDFNDGQLAGQQIANGCSASLVVGSSVGSSVDCGDLCHELCRSSDSSHSLRVGADPSPSCSRTSMACSFYNVTSQIAADDLELSDVKRNISEQSHMGRWGSQIGDSMDNTVTGAGPLNLHDELSGLSRVLELDADLEKEQPQMEEDVVQAERHLQEESNSWSDPMDTRRSSEVFEMALSLTTQPEPDVEQHFRALLTSLDDTLEPASRSGSTSAHRIDRLNDPQFDLDRKLRKLQRLVRQRLRTTAHTSVAQQASSTEGPQQELISLISRVQRNFRANRLQMVHSASSRRSAALAIERFYLKRRRDPFRSPGGRASGKEGSASNILSSVAFTSGTQSAATEQVHLIRAAQAKFRARQHRKKAVRVIETAYGEWKYHAEQARLAAQGERDPSLLNYHAERRERAARCIQGYLLRQQRKEDISPAGESDNSSRVYSNEQLELIRRTQRAFRAHIRHNAVEAKSKLQQSFRDNLERKRRAAGVISKVSQSR